MVDEKDTEEIRPSNEDIYTPPEEQYGDQAPAVATSQSKNYVIMGVFILILGVLFWMFLGNDEEDQDTSSQTPSVAPAPRSFVPPPPFEVPAPIPPEPPAPPKVKKDEKVTDVRLKGGDDPRLRKRLQSNMLITTGLFGSTNLLGGAFGGSEGPTDVYGTSNNNDPNVGFADSFFNQEGVPHAYARKLANTNRLITQGKIIETVLETPINTDIPGMIRAVVSRDVYAESGRAILIPKGSRVVGTYNNFVIRGNKRVNVIWSRVIRPDGFDIMIRSSGTDQLGRAGIEGAVDNKYAEIFSTAFLVSAINIAVGIATDKVDDTEGATETTNVDGSTTRNASAANEAAIDAVDLFGSTAENLVQGFLNLKPTITISQGTRVSIFVNRDLLFPDEFVSDLQIIK